MRSGIGRCEDADSEERYRSEIATEPTRSSSVSRLKARKSSHESNAVVPSSVLSRNLQ